MGGLRRAERCGIESRFEKVANRFDLGRGRAGVGLFDRGQSGVALRSRGFDRIEIFVGEKAEENRDNQGGERGRLFAQR